MEWVIFSFLILACLFSYWGWRWESTRKRPQVAAYPLVSVIIPSYKSPHLQEAAQSAKNLDYPKKEIIIVDDSPGDLQQIEGVTIIKNVQRTGKANALNQAIMQAKGEILFFLDADTVVAPDALKKLVPWFGPNVAAVSPKFTVKNKNNFLTRLISLEHYFISSLYKIHMYFGSLISFRGCGIAVKKDILLSIGGWKQTLIEDIDLAAELVRKGYKIVYEPEAVVRTNEPQTWSEFKKQRLRWGKGTGFSFFHHYKFYLKNPQFGVYIFPYLLLSFAIIGFFLYQTTLYLIPLTSVYLLYTLSFREFIGIFALFILPLIANTFTSVTAGSITHVMIVTNSEREELKDMVMVIPYVFIYFPVTIGIYIKGIFTAISDKKKRKKEVDFKDW